MVICLVKVTCSRLHVNIHPSMSIVTLILFLVQLKLARVSISQAPRSSRASTPALAVAIRLHNNEQNASAPLDSDDSESSATTVLENVRERPKSLRELADGTSLVAFYKLQIIGFLSGLLERLSLLLALPEACKVCKIWSFLCTITHWKVLQGSAICGWN